MSHPLLERLRAADPSVRREACLEAVDDPAATLLVEALCQVLGDGDARVARAAADALVALGPRDPAVRDALDASLHAAVPRQRWRAALARGRLEPPPVKLLPVLVEALEAPEAWLRWSAARLLVEMGRLRGEVQPVLVQLVADPTRPTARPMAVQALRELAPDHPETARALLDAARDADLSLRRAALTALAGLIAPPPEVFEALRAALRDPDPASRSLAAAASRALERGARR